MVLLVRSVIFLATICIILNNMKQCEGSDVSDSNSDDSEPLREALLLVKMIRTVTASNFPLAADLISKHQIRSMLAPSLPIAPQQPLNVSSFNKAEQQEMPSEYYGLKMHTKMVDNGGRPKVKDGRRAFYRRQDYDSYGFGNHPNATTTIAHETTTTTTTSTTAQNPANIDSPTTAAAPSSQNLNKNHVTAKPTRSELITSTSTRRHIKKLSMKVAKNQNTPNEENPEEKDPILFQVESELKNEIKEVPSLNKNRAKDGLLKFKSSPTTLRIHLSSSTRYPIPLPENHALCYTDPENGLCRTPI